MQCLNNLPSPKSIKTLTIQSLTPISSPMLNQTIEVGLLLLVFRILTWTVKNKSFTPQHYIGCVCGGNEDMIGQWWHAIHQCFVIQFASLFHIVVIICLSFQVRESESRKQKVQHILGTGHDLDPQKRWNHVRIWLRTINTLTILTHKPINTKRVKEMACQKRVKIKT